MPTDAKWSRRSNVRAEIPGTRATAASRFEYDQKAVPLPTRRAHYESPSLLGEVNDVFAQDARHTWFITSRYESWRVRGGARAGRRRDFGRTGRRHVAHHSGSRQYSGKLSVAVDAKGRLWHGQASGLYRYDGSAWQLVYGDRAVCDLAPASDGTLFAQVEADPGAGCGGYAHLVLVVQPDGTVGSSYPTTVSLLVSEETATVRTASRRNNLWTVAGDGAIWYVDPWADLPLRRQSASVVEGYPLPVAPQVGTAAGGQPARPRLDRVRGEAVAHGGTGARTSPMCSCR